MTIPWAYISVGSNLGDPLENCRAGIRRLCDGQEVRLLAQSRFYRTAPVDFTDQAWFINAAIKVETALAPFELLHRMHAVQSALGRTPTVRFGPRTLDLDIIFYEKLVLNDPLLTIPHPRMHKRRFVLQPVCDINPAVIHPIIGLDVQTLLNLPVIQEQKIEPCLNC
jgi:2-amino-4-hydroxy-6-hydroxymethyldihydropteridine diphosphokinase